MNTAKMPGVWGGGLLLMGVIAILVAGGEVFWDDPPTLQVSAAASLRDVLPIIVAKFTELTGQKVTLSFASSGVIARQVKSGAPIDLFLSADEKWINETLKDDAVDPATIAIYAYGRLVIYIPTEGTCPDLPRLLELKNIEYARIAIANPELAPYGRAAREALINSGIWSEVKEKIVYGENVAQVYNYATSGNCDAAFIPFSLVGREMDRCVVVPERLYSPIMQSLAVPKTAVNPLGGMAVARFILGPYGQQIFQHYGFAIPLGVEK